SQTSGVTAGSVTFGVANSAVGAAATGTVGGRRVVSGCWARHSDPPTSTKVSEASAEVFMAAGPACSRSEGHGEGRHSRCAAQDQTHPSLRPAAKRIISAAQLARKVRV